jgi:hypothetical protein
LDYLTDGITVHSSAKGRVADQCGQALLFAYGMKPDADMRQARRVLGPDAMIVGAGPRSPLDGRPEFVVYGCGATSLPFVARVLAIDDAFGTTVMAR